MILRKPRNHALGMLIGTTESHLSLLPVIRELAPLREGNQPNSQIPEESWLLSNFQNLDLTMTKCPPL